MESWALARPFGVFERALAAGEALPRPAISSA